MMNFDRLLADRIDLIIERWIHAVQTDRHMKTDDTLSLSAVRDHIPRVLEAIVSILSRHQTDDLQTLVSASLEHGVLRAEQGFEPTEIAREYGLLRSAIFECLEPEFNQEPVMEVYRVFSVINLVVDEALAQSFKSYVDERVKDLEQLQRQVTMAGQEIDRLVRTNEDSLSQQLADRLRTPLSSMIGYTELFLRHQRQSAASGISSQIENIERALRNSRQLLRLINDTTDLLRYENGQLKLHLLLTSPAGVIRQTLQPMEAAINAKGLRVTVDCEAAPEQVTTDPLRLQQIITNLLSNAMRYTESGAIQIRCQALPQQRWSVAVQDTGIGIAPADQSRIFEPYFRVARPDRPLEPEATGLGLAIVLRLVRLLQGDIEMISEVGLGSTFTVSFPVEVTAADMPEPS